MSIACNVEKVRIAKGVSKSFLAKKIGFKTVQGYRHMIKNVTPLSAERLKIIAEVLNVEPAIFYDDKLTETVIKTKSA